MIDYILVGIAGLFFGFMTGWVGHSVYLAYRLAKVRKALTSIVSEINAYAAAAKKNHEQNQIMVKDLLKDRRD